MIRKNGMVYRWFGVVLTATIALEAPAYAATKADQCNKLSVAVNNIKPIAIKLAQSSQAFQKDFQAALSTRDAAKFQAALKTMASRTRAVNQEFSIAIENVSAVSLQDQTLVGLKNQYVQTYSVINQGIADLATSTNKMSQVRIDTSEGVSILQQGAQEMDAFSKKMPVLAKQETAIVDRFNRYCAVQ